MLHDVKNLWGYRVRATDGLIGEVDDLYFDDEGWAIRYLVVGTGTWLSGRHVLVSPIAVGRLDWLDQELPVALTKTQVEDSPNIDTQKPVSRQHEAAYFGYEYPRYWGSAGLWGVSDYPGGPATQHRIEGDMPPRRTPPADPSAAYHLRSCRAIIRNRIHATNGFIGHVSDLLVDDHSWAIRYLIVDTSAWWVGHHVLVAPQWIEAVSWPEATISVDLTRQAVKDAPPYDSYAQFNREHEQAMYEHYGRSGYWTAKDARDRTESSMK